MKEFTTHILVIAALIVCCLLPLLILGGAFGFLGIYFKNYFLTIIGLIIILVLIFLIIIKRKKYIEKHKKFYKHQ